MTTAEAKGIIKQDFMKRYEEWLTDLREMNDHDFGWKYGWCRTGKIKEAKDNLNGVATFQKYFDKMRTFMEFKAIGIDRETASALAREKWLSEAREKWEVYYFVSQRVAKEIWKEAKSKS